MHIQELLHIGGPRLYKFLGGCHDSIALPPTPALLQSVRDAATNIAEWKEVQELVQALSAAQLAREELGDRLYLPDFFVNMPMTALEGMRYMRVCEPHAAAPGTHATLVTWLRHFHDEAQQLSDAYVRYTWTALHPALLRYCQDPHCPSTWH